jgi:hypothetical protein
MKQDPKSVVDQASYYTTTDCSEDYQLAVLLKSCTASSCVRVNVLKVTSKGLAHMLRGKMCTLQVYFLILL